MNDDHEKREKKQKKEDEDSDEDELSREAASKLNMTKEEYYGTEGDEYKEALYKSYKQRYLGD